MQPPPSHDPTHEPFGQFGVRQYVRPIFLSLCAFGLAASLAMMVRSASNYDAVMSVSNGRRVEIGSVIDRFFVTMDVGATRSAENTPWMPFSRPIGTIADGWQPSWRKTLGVEWGTEALDRRGRPAWRLRVKWRTVAIVYALPLAVAGVRSLLRRRRSVAQAYGSVLA